MVTSDAALARKVRALGQYGWTTKYYSTIAGGKNSRMDEIQAAVLRVKLPHLEEWTEQRQAADAVANQRVRHESPLGNAEQAARRGGGQMRRFAGEMQYGAHERASGVCCGMRRGGQGNNIEVRRW